jgi:hypothetical protein
MPFLPGAFIQTTTELFDERGIAWLGDLPNLIAGCERRWSLKVLPPFDLSYNYVAPAICTDGTEVVVKLGLPNPELLTEMAALRLSDGRGSARLLDVEGVVERACAAEGLRLTLKGTLAGYPGCVHWHYKKGKERGTLEITWWESKRRLWFKVAAGRTGEWIEAAAEKLKKRIEKQLMR